MPLLLVALALLLASCGGAQQTPAASASTPVAAAPTATRPERGAPGYTQPAFPGAEGWGAQSVGGRGGRVIEVSNLHDSGKGSLRACAEASGPRTCVFRVNGIIALKRSIEIRHPYLTIAGQTAPGGGIYLRSAPGNESGIAGLLKFPEYPAGYAGEFPHDVIIRYLRIRHGRSPTQKFNGTRPKNLEVISGYNIIIDHVSLGWVNDNLMTIIAPDVDGLPPIHNISVQRTLFAESLDGHSTGINVQGEGDGDRWRNVQSIALHHNLFAGNAQRNPRVTSAGARVINNVAYNWDGHIGSTTRGSVIDWINNYWKPGPNSKNSQFLLHEDRAGEGMPLYATPPSIYIAGNLVDQAFVDPAADNWGLYALRFTESEPLPASFRRGEPLPAGPIPETIESAEAAYRSVLADVGADQRLDCAGNWLPSRDAIDARVIAEVAANTGARRALVHEDDVGGFPQAEPAPPCADADADGMPDEWERAYGFAPERAERPADDADGDGYTNLEEYLNGTNPRDAH